MKMKNLIPMSCIVLSSFFLANIAHARIALSISAEDINSSSSVYNYEIQTTCIGSCEDTIGGIPVSTLFKTKDFYVPYFADAGISSIGSPAGWSSVIEGSNDLFDLGNDTGVIHWEASSGNELALDDSLSGFIYSSSIAGSVKAPYRVIWSNGDSRDGDSPIPASPLAIAAGLAPISTVPAPATVWLFGSAMFGLLGVRGKQRSELQQVA
jgi:hypothetical protein